MRYADGKGVAARDALFLEAVEAASGAGVSRCQHCQTCALGCPVAFAMDCRPDQLVRMVELGLREKALSSSAIWLCAGCQTCSARCPNDVDIPALMDALRQMSVRDGLAAEKGIVAFNRAFLDGVRRYGRQRELPMLLRLKLETRDLLGDLGLGARLLLKRKLPVSAPRFRAIASVRAIFDSDREVRG